MSTSAITRRDVLKAAGATAAAIATPALNGAEGPQATPAAGEKTTRRPSAPSSAKATGGKKATEGRPNILFIMSDDHAAPAISAYGSILARPAPTPNIDRIAKGGMRLNNCFCTNSICTPSRAAIWTGKYSHANGVYKFTALDQSQPTLPKLLRRAGFHTGFVGKYHLHSNPMGFDYWSVLPGQGRYHDPQFVEMGGEHASDRVRRDVLFNDNPLFDFVKLATWVDANVQYYGTYYGRKNIRYKDHPNFRPVPTFEQAISTTCWLPVKDR